MPNNPLLILCGGKSSRMGRPKGLLPYNQSSLIESHINNFKSAGGDKVIIVLGHSSETYLERHPFLKDSLNNWKDNIITTINPDPDRGQFSSLIVGLTLVNSKMINTSCFIQPIDSLPPVNTIFDILEKGANESHDVIKPVFNNRGGHPVLLSNSFIKNLLKVEISSHEARLDLQINSLNENQICKVPVDDKQIVTNINTLADYKKISS